MFQITPISACAQIVFDDVPAHTVRTKTRLMLFPNLATRKYCLHHPPIPLIRSVAACLARELHSEPVESGDSE
jgi:hypothetical protein